jgi:hypothetical protein
MVPFHVSFTLFGIGFWAAETSQHFLFSIGRSPAIAFATCAVISSLAGDGGATIDKGTAAATGLAVAIDTELAGNAPTAGNVGFTPAASPGRARRPKNKPNETSRLPPNIENTSSGLRMGIVRMTQVAWHPVASGLA